MIMRTKLLFIIPLLSFSLCFSQEYGAYETDNEGKLFFTSKSSSSLLEKQGLRAPFDLDLDWSEPDFDISNNPTKDSWDQRMDVGSNGNVFVVYNDNHSNGLQKIMFRKKVGEDWSTPIFVDTGVDIGDRNNHFPAIAASPNGDLHVTYNVWAFENARNFIGYSHYNASTDTWSEGIKISDLNGTVNHTSSHHSVYSTANNLPVVTWGFDNRENQVNEEIYLTYFDGNVWSSDIAVSDVMDGQDAGFPRIKSIGNNQAMIIYSEGTSGGTKELKYKIYDETTHGLSDAKIIASTNVLTDNYLLTTTDAGEVMVLTLHKETAPSRDVFNIYEYDHGSDSFSLSTNSFEVPANAGGLLKKMAMDCNGDGDCGIVYTDFLAEKNFFLEYNPTDGFGAPLVINEQDPGFDPPYAKFDSSGNIHVVWNDKRFDDGQGFDEREVFYKMGRNTTIGLDEFSIVSTKIFPNPSKGSFTIQTNDSFKMEVYNMLGKLLLTKQITGTTQMDMKLLTGTYLLQFSNEKGILTKKLLVE